MQSVDSSIQPIQRLDALKLHPVHLPKTNFECRSFVNFPLSISGDLEMAITVVNVEAGVGVSHPEVDG